MAEEQIMNAPTEVAATEAVEEKTEDLVGTFEDKEGTKLNPWEAKGKFDTSTYDRLVEQFGVQRITDELLERFQKVTGHEPHFWMKRGIFFAHRQLEEILDDHEAGKPIFLYTGRGPTTDALHLGHIISYYFTAWLQKVFNAVVVIQMADDEKYWFKDREFEEIYQLGFKNAKDIIACGFDVNRTFIFSNRDYCGQRQVQDIAFDMMNRTRDNTIEKIFGLTKESTIGQKVWPFYQTAAAFSPYYQEIFGTKDKNVRCLVAYAIDQDPYFRLGRDIAPKMGLEKPCSIMMVFLPALEGDEKMSSTAVAKNPGEIATVFMTDTPEMIHNKVKKFAFSGGRDTKEEHQKYGGNCDKDISYQYLRYFLEDDAELEQIRQNYESGKMLSGEIKERMADCISEWVINHQKERAEITDEMRDEFYRQGHVKV